jgi:hypothetical protein
VVDVDAWSTIAAGVAERRHGTRPGRDESAIVRAGRGAGRQRAYVARRSQRVIHNLFDQGGDLMKVRMVVEALGALRDLRAG